MPNRMLRDCTDSEKINKLDVYAERFFYRLIMVVDDYGRYYAHPGLLKARMFPFLLEKIKEVEVQKWVSECTKAGLILVYEVSGKLYLQILEFKQRLDRAKEKFPPPPVNQRANDFPEVVNDFPPELEVELEREVELETEGPTALYDQFLTYLNSAFEKNYRGDKKSKAQFSARIKEGFTLSEIKTAIDRGKENEFHKGQNYNYLTPEFFTRADKIENFKNAKPVTQNGTAQNQFTGNGTSEKPTGFISGDLLNQMHKIADENSKRNNT